MIRDETEVRQLVTLASENMLHKLLLNMHKPHWKKETTASLLSKYEEEFLELLQAFVIYEMYPSEETRQELYHEAADLSNVIWMLVEEVIEHASPFSINNKQEVIDRWQSLLDIEKIKNCTTSLQYPTEEPTE